jgi:hypothetical protein
VEAGGVAAGKKNAARLGAHLVFVDESGFLLIPSVNAGLKFPSSGGRFSPEGQAPGNNEQPMLSPPFCW